MLPKSFFNRKAEIVAKELLGSFLCTKKRKWRITETEAYLGPHDLASHASKGRTERTEVMFGEPGTIYVYLIYGMYEMLNIVTREKDYPAAVLIRGIEGYDGPGKLTKALKITRDFNNKKLGKDTGLWIERGERPKRIKRTPRIGVQYAEDWRDKKLRFITNKKEV